MPKRSTRRSTKRSTKRRSRKSPSKYYASKSGQKKLSALVAKIVKKAKAGKLSPYKKSSPKRKSPKRKSRKSPKKSMRGSAAHKAAKKMLRSKGLKFVHRTPKRKSSPKRSLSAHAVHKAAKKALKSKGLRLMKSSPKRKSRKSPKKKISSAKLRSILRKASKRVEAMAKLEAAGLSHSAKTYRKRRSPKKSHKRTKRSKKSKRSHRRKAPTQYNLFMRSALKKQKLAHPDMKQTQIMKLAAAQWRSRSPRAWEPVSASPKKRKSKKSKRASPKKKRASPKKSKRSQKRK